MFARTNATGETIPESGTYRVSHSAHRLPDQVTLLQGQQFPRCEKCSEPVKFTLVTAAPHLTSNAGFRVTLFSLPVIEDLEDKQDAA